MDVRSYLPLLTDDVRISISRQLQQRAEQAAEELQQQQQEAGSKQQLNLLRRQMAARQVGERRRLLCLMSSKNVTILLSPCVVIGQSKHVHPRNTAVHTQTVLHHAKKCWC
jgi:hypothetical protein